MKSFLSHSAKGILLLLFLWKTAIAQTPTPYEGVPVFVPATMAELSSASWVNMSFGSYYNPELTQGYSTDPNNKTHQIILSASNDNQAYTDSTPIRYLQTMPDITEIPDWDEDTDGPLRVIKLGDNIPNTTTYQSSRISYYFKPTEEKSILIVYFAFVVQNPSHFYTENPRFHIEVLQGNGQPVEPHINSYFLANPQGSSPSPNPNAHDMNYHICGSSSYDSRHWCDWTPIAFDLRDYIGQEIRLTITTSDCIPQGHYGYGYFTARGAEGEITSDAWGSDSVRLSLPSGFASYTWYRGTEQIASGSRHVVVPRTRYENYHCATQSRTGAVMDFRTQVLSYSLAAAFETQILHNQVDFRNTGTISMLEDTIYTVPVTFIEWDFGDNTETSHEINPSHRYEHPGTYTVKCIIYGPDRLFSDTVTKEITIESIIPSAPSLITGPEVVSVGHFWYYTVEEVPYADSYEWNLEPADWPVTKINDREISIEVTSPGSAVLSVYARNEHGRSPDATKSISSTTGMEAFDEKRQLHVFPNPASDYIVVKHGCKDPENVSISIIDIAGKEIGRYIPDNDEKKIDIDSFIPGIYFIRLEESNKIIDTYKWIKY